MFYDHINKGECYICDRCKVVELREDEYINNNNRKGIYCDECWRYIRLQKATCIYCTSSWSKRSEREVTFNCECGGLVVCHE